MSMKRGWNFSAGPAALPVEVLEEASRNVICAENFGMSIMEMSHRSKGWVEIQEETKQSLSTLLSLPETHDIIFLQGGATIQFAMVPLNLMRKGDSADYIITGGWAKKAVNEATKLGFNVRIAGSSEESNFSHIPESCEIDPDAAYVHFTSNNTLVGTEWTSEPDVGDRVLVCDASSNILSKPINVSKYGLIYSGAQKNLGPAGVTLVIIQKDLLDRAPENIPSYMTYKTHVSKNSAYNTPPVWIIYMVGLVARWLINEGGLTEISRKNKEKAELLYDTIDGEFYRGTATPDSRSLMNVTFLLPSKELEATFLEDAEKAGLYTLKGHRSIGGLRASIYNAMPREGVEALVQFMKDFREKNS